MYNRIIKPQILDKLFCGKAIIIVGSRQVGKTTLSNILIKESRLAEEKVMRFNCDNPTDREALNNRDFEFLKQLIGKQENNIH